MDRWLLRTSEKSSVEPSTSASALRPSDGTGMHDAGDGEKKKRRKYQKEFIQYGFTCHAKNQVEHPQCVLCGHILANESLKPVKMKRHLETRHPDHAQKPIQFFQRKETALLGQKSVIYGQATVPTKALAASYEVAHLVAKAQKPHTIAESLLLPAATAMTGAMHGETIANALKTIPLSNDTMSRRIFDIVEDMKCQLLERVKSSRFSLQLDESTDMVGVAHLMVFIRCSHEGKLHEDMLFCAALEGKCTGDDIFNCLKSWMEHAGLCWEKCISICTDGAGAMMGKNKGLKAKVLSVAPHIRFTHCVIHREALAAKTLQPELEDVLQTSVKIVNHIKSRPLNTRLFAILCQEMGSTHESLLFHSEVRWLSRGKVRVER